MKSIAMVALVLLLMNIANATTESSESHMRYNIENMFETYIGKIPLVTDVNCTILENNTILLKIYCPPVSSFTFSTIEGGSRYLLGTSIMCHVRAMNTFPIIEGMIVQLYDSTALRYTMYESRPAINGILVADLESEPDMLANMVQTMISTKKTLKYTPTLPVWGRLSVSSKS